jgi:hypothetical protein
VDMGPGGQLLQAEHVRLVGRCELHHLLEICPPPRRLRVAMEDVPGANEERQSEG